MPNDVFIAFKNLDVKGAPTRDLEIARDVYEFLTTRGLKVFFSVVTLEDLGISAYKNAIDQALDSASVLVAIGTSADNLNSTWVSYEWDSFYNDILSGIKPNGRVFTYIEGMTVAALPRALRQTQTFLHSAASLQRLFNFIIKTLPAPEGSRTLPAQNKERVRPETKKLEKVSERSAAQNYRYHVFISYARVYDALTGWVSSFKQRLEGKLREKLPGETALVYLDVGEIGVGPLKSELHAAVSSSAILLIVLSNRWLERPWCQQELALFVETAGGPLKAQERIVLVRIEDVKQNRLPEVLQNCHPYDFFKVHPTRKVTLTFGLPEFPELESDYLLSMLQLVGDEDRPGLVTQLIKLIGPKVDQRNSEGIERADDRRVIFLADCTPDLSSDRGRLRRHLEDKGFRVVPTGIRSFYDAPPRYDEDFRQLVAKSILFIQIVGRFRYETTDNFPDGYEFWQLEQARKIKGKSGDILRWRRPDVPRDEMVDDAHREFVFADDVTECDLEEFKVVVDAKLHEINSGRDF